MDHRVTFGQLKDDFDNYQNTIPKIDESDITILWMNDYYDGMLAGMLEYKKKRLRFEIITDFTKNIGPRIFAIIELSKDEINEETSWNNLFKKHVGNHNNFDSDEELRQQPRALWHLFYDQYKQRRTPNYEGNSVKGWFMQ